MQGVTCEVSKAMTPVGLGEGEARARLLGWATARAQTAGRGVCVRAWRCAVGCVKGFAQVRALAAARPPQVSRNVERMRREARGEGACA